ncbi:uncharacterized protein LOC112686582 [Sipha flava]|uniref:Uncharacterized protein LOC112686582 n=1 Tax=Sipha flava TaxID=143950 RepID=A0A8B8FWK9_9HEMI|nr:uncharacterized protein LOC112686582 [Sipha flava]XP_025414723.1 uncharacterized protein LOC112686582 [Sipha flava]XP_025414724.1 uncharacterized protein LOC112686582 [Sipha flava]XP_025414726.1 uncharacterized protein LOC112686582 [Sipha flava]XP_025414727.1 uncharacterized protein LOC112686582 [Sipha flava]XP_025414728.1 uncharacterized protein LOC112686582 [Sipha flava]XP_025414729.1 uncharacterized protein LOC112686582 [Sipha flava]XP_025414730.1 uncharacterized protein LOC112686582 [
MHSSCNKETIELLLCKIEVQNTVIGELSSKIDQMKVDFKVQNKSTALELASLREKCEHFQHKVEVVEANPPMNVKLKFDQFHCTLNALCKENEFLKRKIQNICNKMNYIESQLGHCSLFGDKNERYQINSEIFDSVEVENDNISCYEEFADSCMFTSSVQNEEPAITTAVDSSFIHRSDETKVQQASTNKKPTIPIKDNTDYVLTTRLTPNDLNSEFHSLNMSNGDVTCTSAEENRSQVMTKLTGHSVQVQKQIDTTKSTVNDIKYANISNPICALNELCMARNWTLPKYEFFKEGDNKSITYSVKCTVMMSTVRVEGLMKKEGKRRAANMMYNKLKDATISNVPLEKNYEVTSELIGHSKSTIFHEQKHNDMIKSTANNLKNSHLVNAINIEKLELNSICTLNELCMSRNWSLPKYEFFIESDNKTLLYSVKCTVMTSTVRVKGLMKKEVKRHAAIIMYNKLKDDIITCAGLAEEQTIATVVDHPASLAEHYSYNTNRFLNRNKNCVSLLNESVDSHYHADLANRLRLSNNPSICKLKELNYICKFMVPSCVKLLNRIVEEEGLTIEYEICIDSRLAIEKNCKAIDLAIRPGTLTVIGYGETTTECQEDASYKCLIRFKSMLREGVSDISSLQRQ